MVSDNPHNKLFSFYSKPFNRHKAIIRGCGILFRTCAFRNLFCKILFIVAFYGFSSPYGQSNWVWKNPLPQGNTLNCVTYGNNKFVSVGNHGTIMTSPDGTTWTLQKSQTKHNLNSVTYGNGKFICIGDSSTIATSIDGATWASQQLIKINKLNSIAFGNDKFTIVGDSNTTLISIDGFTWEAHKATNSVNRILFIYFDGHKFWATTDSGSIITSVDGANWLTQKTTSMNNLPTSIVYGNNQYIGVYAPGSIFSSTDGSTWSDKAVLSNAYNSSITYGNNLFVLVSDEIGIGKILTSFDGATWTFQNTSDTINGLNYVTYGNGVFVAVGRNSTILNSLNGINWTNTIAPIPDNLVSITTNGEFLMALGQKGAILTSPDGIKWTRKANCLGSGHLIYGNNRFVHVQSYSSEITVDSGSTWIEDNSRSLYRYAPLSTAFGNNIFVTVGASVMPGPAPSSRSQIRTSTNGLNWTTSQQEILYRPNSIAYGNHKFVTACDSGVIGTSIDGMTWIFQNSGTFRNLKTITYGNDQFVAVADSGIILTSSDCTIWKISNYSSNAPFSRVVSGKHSFVALSGYNTVSSSSDGISWQDHQLDVDYPLSSLIYYNDQFVAIGGGLNILSSYEDDFTRILREDGNTFDRRQLKITYSNARISISTPGTPMSKIHQCHIDIFNAAGNLFYSGVSKLHNEKIVISPLRLPAGGYCIFIKDGKYPVITSSFIVNH